MPQTQLETQPLEKLIPVAEPGFAPEPIDIDALDKDNRGWVSTYLGKLRERLVDEQAAAQPDFVMVSYLKRELSTYNELIERLGVTS
jgi:hypothetical protein